MQVLLSSIGSRGDVQPILALALELKALGHDATLCVAPNFKDWIESYGAACIPIGPNLKKLTGGTAPGKPIVPSSEQLQRMAEESVRGQFHVVGEAARGCDLLLGAGALQIALRSVAEAQKVPYIFVATARLSCHREFIPHRKQAAITRFRYRRRSISSFGEKMKRTSIDAGQRSTRSGKSSVCLPYRACSPTSLQIAHGSPPTPCSRRPAPPLGWRSFRQARGCSPTRRRCRKTSRAFSPAVRLPFTWDLAA
jgi:hypothetical protein